MKSKFFLLSAPFALLVLGQCAVVDDSRNSGNSGSMAVSGLERLDDDTRELLQKIYKDGYELGSSDGRMGRSRNHKRYDGWYVGGRRPENIFLEGYNKGYSQGLKNPVPSSSPPPSL